MEDGNTTPINRPKVKILVVEDDMIIGELYVASLTSLGYEVVWARNGQDGLMAALKQQFDVILLDILMPEMDGDTMLRELRGKGEDKIPNTKVIVFTNSARNADTHVIRKYADDYLIKADITPRQLISKIEKLLSKND